MNQTCWHFTAKTTLWNVTVLNYYYFLEKNVIFRSKCVCKDQRSWYHGEIRQKRRAQKCDGGDENLRAINQTYFHPFINCIPFNRVLIRECIFKAASAAVAAIGDGV